MSTSPIVDRMAARLRELEAQDARLKQQAENIAAQQETIAREADQLHIAMGLIPQYEDDAASEEADTMPLPIPLTGTIADAAAEVIRQHGGELELSQILDALLRAGKLRPTPNSRTTLWKTLNRKRDMFAKAGDGRWRLVGDVGEDLDDDHPKVTVMTR